MVVWNLSAGLPTTYLKLRIPKNVVFILSKSLESGKVIDGVELVFAEK